jgi:hypothetical protein
MLEPVTTVRSRGAAKPLEGSSSSHAPVQEHTVAVEIVQPRLGVERVRQDRSGRRDSPGRDQVVEHDLHRRDRREGVPVEEQQQSLGLLHRLVPPHAPATELVHRQRSVRNVTLDAPLERRCVRQLEQRGNHVVLAGELEPRRVDVAPWIRSVGKPLRPVLLAVECEPVDGANVGGDVERERPRVAVALHRRVAERLDCAAHAHRARTALVAERHLHPELH